MFHLYSEYDHFGGLGVVVFCCVTEMLSIDCLTHKYLKYFSTNTRTGLNVNDVCYEKSSVQSQFC